MSKKHVWRRVVTLAGLLVALFSPLSAGVAYAHGVTEVGDYEIEIGWHNEPAYVGEVNAVEFFVTNTATDEPVNGLEDSLQMELIFGASSRELPIVASDEEEGAYFSPVLLTEEGDYTVHLTGDIEGTAVDISMISGPGTFDTVETEDAIAFPGTGGTAATRHKSLCLQALADCCWARLAQPQVLWR